MNAPLKNILEEVNRRIREVGWENVTQPERDIANVDAFYASVLNGGLDSIFFSSAYLGDMSVEISESLERVGAVRAARLLKDAFEFFPDGIVPANLDARVAVLRRVGSCASIDALTDRFYREAERQEEVIPSFAARVVTQRTAFNGGRNA